MGITITSRPNQDPNMALAELTARTELARNGLELRAAWSSVSHLSPFETASYKYLSKFAMVAGIALKGQGLNVAEGADQRTDNFHSAARWLEKVNRAKSKPGIHVAGHVLGASYHRILSGFDPQILPGSSGLALSVPSEIYSADSARALNGLASEFGAEEGVVQVLDPRLSVWGALLVTQQIGGKTLATLELPTGSMKTQNVVELGQFADDKLLGLQFYVPPFVDLQNVVVNNIEVSPVGYDTRSHLATQAIGQFTDLRRLAA